MRVAAIVVLWFLFIQYAQCTSYQRACPSESSSTPPPSEAVLNFVELGPFAELGCTANTATNPPNIPCPELIYLPDKSFASIYPGQCFTFDLAKPVANYNIAQAGLALFIIEFSGFFWYLARRRYAPLNKRDAFLTFITFATSFANSVIPFGVIVYGLSFPVGFFIYAAYISAPLTTQSLAFRCYQFWFKWKWDKIQVTDPRKLKWAKWAWTTVSWKGFPIYMILFFALSFAIFAENFQLYPQDFENNPYVFETGRCSWFYFGENQVNFIQSINQSQSLLPSPYNPNGYVPYSPYFASCTVYPSSTVMGYISNGFLGFHCSVLFAWAFVLYGKQDALFIRGELWFMIGDILTVVVLIIASGWQGEQAVFTPNGFSLSNLFYILNDLVPWMGCVLVPVLLTYTRTFNRNGGAMMCKHAFRRRNARDSQGHSSSDPRESTQHSTTRNPLLVLYSVVNQWRKTNDVSAIIPMTVKEKASERKDATYSLSIKHAVNVHESTCERLCFRNRASINSRNEPVKLRLIGLRPETLLFNVESERLSKKLANEMLCAESIDFLIWRRSFQRLFISDDLAKQDPDFAKWLNDFVSQFAGICTQQHKIWALAQLIKQKFLEENSPNQVNISGPLRQKYGNMLDQSPFELQSNMFDEIVVEIYSMLRDMVTRFESKGYASEVAKWIFEDRQCEVKQNEASVVQEIV